MLIEFLIGLFAVNALPRYLFGRMNVGVPSFFLPRRSVSSELKYYQSDQ